MLFTHGIYPRHVSTFTIQFRDTPAIRPVGQRFEPVSSPRATGLHGKRWRFIMFERRILKCVLFRMTAGDH